MVANWGFNTGLGMTALILTFCFSWENNIWQTSLFRAAIGFILFFILGYLFQILLYWIGSKKELESLLASEQVPNKNTTVNDDEAKAFQPISLTSLHNEIVQEKVAQTVRTWVAEDQEG